MFNNKKINDITNMPILDKYDIKMPDADMKKILNIFDNSIYTNYFKNQIIGRGEEYSNLVTNIREEENTYICNITGKDYKVTVTFDKDNIKDASCTCPYNDYCKHIYALVYKLKCENNKNIIINEFNNIDKAVRIMIEKSDEFISTHILNDDVKAEYKAYTKYYYDEIVSHKNIINKETREDILFKYLMKIIKLSSLIKLNIEKNLNNKNIDKITENSRFIKEKNNNININIDMLVNDKRRKRSSVSLLGSILGAIIDAGTKPKSSNDLEDWQQKLVNKGMYDETSFDESEELEEDDYYYEDD